MDVTLQEPRAYGIRQLVSILLLPFTATVIVPLWWLGGWVAIARGGFGAWGHGALAVGVAAFATGFALFVWCVGLFGRVGRGTLAPWDPTRRLVAVGPYRYVRNPMISGVAAMLLGEALVIGSRPIAIWLAAFVVINHVYFIVSEEPGLRDRFGAEYVRYCEMVPRWIPRPPRRHGPAPGT